MSRPRLAIAERIARHSIVQPDGCKFWVGHMHASGHYPVLAYRNPQTGRRSSLLVHRWVYAQTHPEEPPLSPRSFVKQTCRHGQCIAAEHLYRVQPKAPERPTRLSSDQVAAIRALRALPEGERPTLAALAAQYQVHPSTISLIAVGRRRKNG